MPSFRYDWVVRRSNGMHQGMTTFFTWSLGMDINQCSVTETRPTRRDTEKRLHQSDGMFNRTWGITRPKKMFGMKIRKV